MAKLSSSLLAIIGLLPLAFAQSPVWGQCGGETYTGPTTCVAGSVCVFFNDFWSQCQPGNGPVSSTSTPAQTTTVQTTTAQTTTAQTTPPPVTTTSTSTGSTATGLNNIAKSIGKKYFGSATDNSELSDAAYVAILKNTAEFGQITPANSMKWDATEPSNGVFTFTNGDQIANFAKANGQLLRGHNLAWHQQLPNWVNSVPASQMASVLTTHVSTVAGHYKGQVYAWDVVNEPWNDDGSLVQFALSNALGQQYISIALTAARAADPAAKLYINDFNIETAGAKATAMLNLVKSLKASGTPIDGIGMESHLIVGQVPSAATFIANFEAFTALGVEIAITELDIRMNLPATPQLLAQQQTDYMNVVSACKAVAGCVGVTVWDYTDKYSWVPGTFSGQGAACPWDSNLAKKAAYNGIVAGL